MESEQEKFYIREFERFENGKLREGNKLDNTILIVGAGAFVLSITYLAGLERASILVLLVISWVSLLLSIMAHIFSYKLSVNYHKNRVDRLNKWVRDGYNPRPYIDDGSKEEKNIAILNNWTLFFLVVGMIFLTIFVSYNLLI